MGSHLLVLFSIFKVKYRFWDIHRNIQEFWRQIHPHVICFESMFKCAAHNGLSVTWLQVVLSLQAIKSVCEEKENKEIRTYKSTPDAVLPVTPRLQKDRSLDTVWLSHPSCPQIHMMMVMMQTSVLLSCAFTLQCLRGMHCLPMRGASKYKVAPVSGEKMHFLMSRTQMFSLIYCCISE